MINELMILGQIPGTNIQITFNDYIAVMCILVLDLVWRRNPRLIRYAIAKLEFWVAIFNLRFKQPAILVGHRG